MNKKLLLLVVVFSLSMNLHANGLIACFGGEYSLHSECQRNDAPGVNVVLYGFPRNRKIGAFLNLGVQLPYGYLPEYSFPIQMDSVMGVVSLLLDKKRIQIYAGAGIKMGLSFYYREDYQLYQGVYGIGGDIGVKIRFGHRFSIIGGSRLSFDFLNWTGENDSYWAASGWVRGFYQFVITPYIGF